MADRPNGPDSAIGLACCGMTTFGVLVLPVVIAIWGMPWFVTQDGPSHLYNAHLISELLRGQAPVRDVYLLSWMPLPNLAGHWLLVALMQILSARTADQLLMMLTWLGVASAVLWLRWRVAGWKGLAAVAPLAVFIASNFLWLLGFYNFLLGVCLFPVTHGYWWISRQQMQVKNAAILGGLLVLGYFCHLVSAALTISALGLLTRSARTYIEAIPSAGMGKRIGTLRIHMPPRGKVLPVFHMDSMIALGTNGIIWQNYEAVAYYFPVQYRDPLDKEVVQEFHNLEVSQWRNLDIMGWIDQWARLLAEQHSKIDVLVTWGRDPRLDAINMQWYSPEPVFHSGDLRVFHHR